MIYTVYTQSRCGFCDAAKNLLEASGIAFTEISIEHDQDARIMLKDMGCKTVPQIFNGELHIGGYTELKEYLT